MISYEETQAPSSNNKYKLEYYELINHNDYLLITMMIQTKTKADVKLSKSEGKPKRKAKRGPAPKARVARAKSTTKKVRKQGPVQSVGPRSRKGKKN